MVNQDVANRVDGVQPGIPFTGEGLEVGMVVTVFDCAEIMSSHCRQTVAGAYDSDKTTFEHKCFERPEDVAGMGAPLTVICVMHPYIVIQDDHGLRGTMDVRNRTFMLVTQEYRDAVNHDNMKRSRHDAQPNQEQKKDQGQVIELPPAVQVYIQNLQRQIDAQNHTAQFLLNFAIQSQVQGHAISQLQLARDQAQVIVRTAGTTLAEPRKRTTAKARNARK